VSQSFLLPESQLSHEGAFGQWTFNSAPFGFNGRQRSFANALRSR
jgi:hypothetical protein